MSDHRAPAGSRRAGGGPRRLATAGVLLALAAAALVAGTARDEPAAAIAAPREAAILPPDGVASSAWFCPGGVPGDGEPVRDALYITNLSTRATSVRVTVLTTTGRPVGRQIAIEPQSVKGISVADLSEAPDAAVVVEPFSDDILVEQTVSVPGKDDVALGPCATHAGATWYFAAGSTLKGSEQWLSLLNPYAIDAVVDITLVTNEGRRRPDGLRGLVIPARSRVPVHVNEFADRKLLVAVIVESRDGGRVVAQQTVVHDRVAGRSGVTSTLGVPAPATRFTFASGSRRDGVARLLFVMNPGVVPIDVDVQLAADGATPQTIKVGAGAVEAINVNDLVPGGEAYSVIVQSAADFDADGEVSDSGGIVAEDWENYRVDEARESFFGVAGGIGGIAPATEWRFGRSRLRDERKGYVMLYNPAEGPAHVSVEFVGDGASSRPADATEVEIPGASRIAIRIDTLSDIDGGLIVTSDRAVYAERFLVKNETVTRSPGVPRRD